MATQNNDTTVIAAVSIAVAIAVMGIKYVAYLKTGSVALYSAYKLWSGTWVVRFPRGEAFRIEWDIVRALFRFGLPSGVQGVAMNVGGVMLLGFIGSLTMGGQAERRSPGRHERVDGA